jgi:hypothetical protein
LLELYEALGSEHEHKRWAESKRELGIRSDQETKFVSTKDYGALRGADAAQAEQQLQDAIAKGCVDLSAEDLELVEGWTRANAQAVELARRATAKPVLYVPMSELGGSSLDVVGVLHLARALQCTGGLRLHARDVAPAVRDAIALWKLGDLVRTNQSLLLTAVGMMIVSLGSDLALRISADPGTGRADISHMLASMPVVDERATLIAVVNHDRIEALRSLLSPIRSAKPSKGLLERLERRARPIDVEAVLRRVNQTYDMAERAASRPTHAGRVQALDAASKEVERRAEQIRHTSAGWVALQCALPFGHCPLSESFADMVVTGAIAINGGVARKLHEKVLTLEGARRTLTAATAGP